MNRRSALALVLVVCSILPGELLPQTPTGSVEQFTRTSHIIFVGRVEKLRAANPTAVIPSEVTALVRVEELLDVPPSLVGIQGQVVSVEKAMFSPPGTAFHPSSRHATFQRFVDHPVD